MKGAIINLVFIGLSLISICNGCIAADEFSVLKGPYLGKKPLGMTPDEEYLFHYLIYISQLAFVITLMLAEGIASLYYF